MQHQKKTIFCQGPVIVMAWALCVPLFAASLRAQQPPPTLSTRHQGPVSALAYSSDGALLASGGHDGLVKIWDCKSGVLVHTIAGPFDRVLSLEFTPDDKKILVGRINVRAEVHSLSSQESMDISGPRTGGYCGARLSQDGKFFAAGGDAKLRFGSVINGKISGQIVDHDQDRFWDVAISPDHRLVAGASGTGVVKVWAVKDRKLLMTLGSAKDGMRQVFFLGQNKLLGADAKGNATLWQLDSQTALASFTMAPESTWSRCRIAHDGTMLAYLDHSNTVRVGQAELSIDKMKAVHLEDRGREVLCLALTRNGGALAIGLENGDIRTIDLAGTKQVRLLGVVGAQPHDVAVTDAGRLIVVTKQPGATRVLSLPTSRVLWHSTTKSWPRMLTALAPKGRFLGYCQRGGAPKLVDLQSSKERVFNKNCLVHGVFAIAPNGKRMAIVDAHGGIAIWRPEGKQPLAIFPGNKQTGVLGLAFSQDGRELLMSGKGNFIRRVLVANGKILATRMTPNKEASKRTPAYDRAIGWVKGLACGSGRDGRYILCGGPYANLVLRDDALNSIQCFRGHVGGVRSVALVTKNRFVSAGGDGTLRIWDKGRPSAVAKIEFVGERDWMLTESGGRTELTAGALALSRKVTRTPEHSFDVQGIAAERSTPGLLSKLLTKKDVGSKKN